MKCPLLLSGFALLAVCGTAPISAQEEKTPAPPASQETSDGMLERAYELISEGKFKQAQEELEKATALAGGPCGECLLGFSHVYAAEGKWDRAVDAAQRAIPLLRSPGPQARAYDQLGVALVARGGPDALSKAEEALRQGADLGGAWGLLARYNLAEVLARQQKWAEAVEAARRYLKEAGPVGTALKEARILVCRARSHMPEDVPLVQGENQDAKQIEGEVTRPEIIFQVKPVYTEKARKVRTAGAVIVKAIIDEEGCVRGVKPLQELSNGMTEAAVEAVRQWVFSPAMLAGKPVKVYYVLTINFRVELNKTEVWLPGTL